MYLLAYKLSQHLKEIAALVHEAPIPAGAATWCMEELAARTGLRVVVLGHHAAPSSRFEISGAEVISALREGLAQEEVDLTREAAWELVGALTEELMAYDLGDDNVGEGDLERGWGELL